MCRFMCIQISGVQLRVPETLSFMFFLAFPERLYTGQNLLRPPLFFYYLQKFNISKSFPLSTAVINAQLFMLNNCNQICNNSTMAVFVKKRGMRVRYVSRIGFSKGLASIYSLSLSNCKRLKNNSEK